MRIKQVVLLVQHFLGRVGFRRLNSANSCSRPCCAKPASSWNGNRTTRELAHTWRKS